MKNLFQFSRLIMGIVFAALLFSGFSAIATEKKGSKESKKIKVLLVDGQNNHNWAKTSPIMKATLEKSGRFTVDVATAPPRGKDMSKFRPKFKNYDVVLSNYNGQDWPEATQKDFEEYVKAGGGVSIIHAANNSFPKWKAFNEMIGLGGWGGRNEKSGPYIRLRDGKFVEDHSKGRGGSHGRQHPFSVTHHVPDHPILKGLPKKWLHARDELYDRLRGPAKNMKVLATSFAAKSHGGTDEHEPIIMTISYGKGRIFHTPMGHSPHSMLCTGFQFILLRGTEWAAKGKVTFKKIPKNFPTEDKVSLFDPIKGEVPAEKKKKK